MADISIVKNEISAPSPGRSDFSDDKPKVPDKTFADIMATFSYHFFVRLLQENFVKHSDKGCFVKKIVYLEFMDTEFRLASSANSTAIAYTGPPVGIVQCSGSFFIISHDKKCFQVKTMDPSKSKDLFDCVSLHISRKVATHNYTYANNQKAFDDVFQKLEGISMRNWQFKPCDVIVIDQGY